MSHQRVVDLLAERAPDQFFREEVAPRQLRGPRKRPQRQKAPLTVGVPLPYERGQGKVARARAPVVL